MSQVLAENLTPSEAYNQFSYYPVWIVTATFQWTNPINNSPVIEVNGTIIAGGKLPSNATWINGYDVTIWAGTGQIADSGPTGVM